MKVRISLKRGAQTPLAWETKKNEPLIGGEMFVNNIAIGRIVKYNQQGQEVDVKLFEEIQLPDIHVVKPIILSDAKPTPPIDENRFQDPYFKKLARVKNSYSYSPVTSTRAFAHHVISG